MIAHNVGSSSDSPQQVEPERGWVLGAFVACGASGFLVGAVLTAVLGRIT